MKYIVYHALAVCLCVLPFTAKMLSATTFAYIPSYEDDRVVRVNTTNPDGESGFAVVTIDPQEADGGVCGPYGVAVLPDVTDNLRYAIVTCEGDSEGDCTNRSGDAVGTFVRILHTDFENQTVPSTRIYNGVTGDTPRGVAIEPDGEYAYIANYCSDTVTMIDLSGYQAVASPVTVGEGPLGVAAVRNADQDVLVYVTNNLDGSITVITHKIKTQDSQTTTSRTLDNICKRPAGIVAIPGQSAVYVACQGTEGVLTDGGIYRILTNALDTPPARIMGGNPYFGVAAASQGRFVLATNSQALPSATATIIDTANLKPSGYGVTGSAFGIAAPKNGSFAYLVDQTDNNGIYALNTNGKLDEVTSGDEAFQLNTPYALGAFMGGAPPVAPSDLTGTTNTYDRIDLTWSDNSDDELGFKIERRVKPEDGEENSYVEVAQVGQDVTSHTDGGLVGNNTYEYRIRAFNEAADSGYAILSGDGGGVTTEEGGFSWCFIGSLLE